MKLPRVLVLDDQYARDDTERMLFVKRAGLVEKEGKRAPAEQRIPIACATFCSGQIFESSRIRNEYAVIRDAVERHHWSLILLDVRFDSGVLDDKGRPGGEPGDDHFGESVRAQLLSDFPNLPIAMLSSKRQEEIADDAVPYISKHGFDARVMRDALLRYGRVSAEQSRILLGVRGDVVLESGAMLDVFRQALIHGPRNVSVLILGASGVGKELLARFIHDQSGRPGPFVGVNIASLSRDLLEAELFGVEKRTATGVDERPGKFELANRGTLFLDEIGDMPLPAQVAVLRALQEREIYRVGGQKPLPLDIRLICATSSDLEILMSEGGFRRDLYHRINTLTLAIPPLRERAADIVPLAQAFLEKFQAEFDLVGISISPEALEILKAQPFPGNVRELENVVRRLVSGTGNHRVISAAEVRDALDAPPIVAQPLMPLAAIPATSNCPPAPDGSVERQPDTLGLADLPRVIECMAISKDDPALSGMLPKIDTALKLLRKRLAGAALERCRDPVSGAHNRQRAMQLLAGDPSLKAKGPPRMINEIIGRKQEADVSDEDLDELIAAWWKAEQTRSPLPDA